MERSPILQLQDRVAIIRVCLDLIAAELRRDKPDLELVWTDMAIVLQQVDAARKLLREVAGQYGPIKPGS